MVLDLSTRSNVNGMVLNVDRLVKFNDVPRQRSICLKVTEYRFNHRRDNEILKQL